LRYRQEKKQGARTDLTCGQNDQKLATAEKIATQHNVTEKTVRRAEKFADGVDKIAVEAEEICKVIAEAVEAERVKKMAEAKTGMKYRQEHEKEENFTPELIPEPAKAKPVIETRAKIAETFNTNPRYISDAED